MAVTVTLSKRTRGSFLSNSNGNELWETSKSKGFLFSSRCKQSVSYTDAATASFWDETLLRGSPCLVQFPNDGRVCCSKQMFLLAPVTASVKSVCRKLLWPLLLFTLDFFHLNSSVCFFACFFLWVFCGWVLFCGNSSPGEKERTDYMCN